MKKLLFKTISIVLIITHLITVSFRDVGFAEEAEAPAIEAPTTSDSSQIESGTEFGASLQNEASETASAAKSASEPQAPVSQLVGAGNFNARPVQIDTFTGQANLSIPITVPAGRAGMQPQIALSYSSGSPNGIAGMGWSLNMDSIQRSTKKGVPKYNDSQDAFVFIASGSSQELANIGGNEYRSKVEEGFLKITHNTSDWLATDKTGKSYKFGVTSNSRQTNSYGTFSWYLSEVIDINGNSMQIQYTQDNGQIYPLSITYDINRVDFIYETRPDTSFNYITNSLISNTKRLKEIQIKTNGALARKYILGYSVSVSTTRSLLNSVTLYGADGTTALPPVTFTYRANRGGWSADKTKWHTPGSKPLVGFYDVNGDGISDYVDNTKIYLGSRDGFDLTSSWNSVPLSFGNLDTGIRFVDLNADGIPDVSKSYAYNTQDNPTTFSLTYTKNSYIFQYTDPANPRWVKSTQWNLPKGVFHYKTNGPSAPDYNYIDGDASFADLNGDGLNDLSITRSLFKAWYQFSVSGEPIGPPQLVYSEPSVVNTYINTGNGWQSDTRWNSPDGYYAIYTNVQSGGGCVLAGSENNGDGGRRLIDINGDGLADLLIAVNGHKATYLNNGHGWTRNDAYNIPDGDFSDTGNVYGKTQLANQGRFLIDINGDGLPDLVIAKNSYRAVYINTGSGWKKDNTFNIPDGYFLDSKTENQGRFLTDLDGDGAVDLCVSYTNPTSGNTYRAAYLNLTGAPDLLISVDNGLGGNTDIEYTPSTAYDNYYSGTKLGRLPFPVQVVSKVTSNDGQSSSYSTSYSYQGGYFAPQPAREFRGFGTVKTIDAEGNYTESYFKQDDILKGRLYRQEIKDKDGNLYSKTENTWTTIQPYTGVNFVYLSQTDNYDYEGQSTPKHTQVKFEYDNYGNPAKVISQGDADVSGDEKTQTTDYTYNTTAWLLSFPKTTSLFDAYGNLVSQKNFYYDNHTSIDEAPAKGLLTKQEAQVASGLQKSLSTVSTQYIYDNYGNLISSIDSLGHSVNTTYDTASSIFPVRVTNALSQNVQNTYYGINESAAKTLSAGFGLVGQLKTTTDPNGKVAQNIYDSLGRLVKVIGPNDTEANPGIIYEYDLAHQPIKVTKKVKDDSSGTVNYLTTYEFYDGLGRLIEIKSPAEPDPATGAARQIILGLVIYDERGQVKEKYLPYFTLASVNFVAPAFDTPHASFIYDALGRVTQSINPDLSYAAVAYGQFQKTITDENNHSKTEYYDAYGKVVKVEENNSGQIYTTTYEYDTPGNLTKTTDNQGNITQIWYDSLGRKVKINDPDMGVWLYEYDSVGNLTKQTDTKGQILTFTYDSLNRLVNKKANGSTLATYTYDSGTNGIGRLAKVTDKSGSTEFFYDNLGREIKSVKTVSGSGSFTIERAYDSLGRLLTLKYPDGEVIKYSYNPQGIAIVTNTSGKIYISNIDYSPTGQILKIQYGNGAETNYAYDLNTLRLSHLATQSSAGNIQDLAYTFDKVGNVSAINDSINTNSQTFLYDDLNRLIQASGSYGAFSYAYDSIGNMTNKEGINMNYGKAGRLPHAVTQYGSTSIDYDSNGNMIKKGGLELSYDAENRLAKVEDKSAAQPITLNITLQPGWNLVSIPVVPTDTKVGSVFASIQGKYDQVSRYNSTNKSFENYVGNASYDQFSTIEYGRGYEIYITSAAPVTLTVTGTVPQSQAVTLKSGYNLISCPKSIETPVETALKPLKLGVDYAKVLHYNKNTASFEIYDASTRGFTRFIPGESYYLYCLKDTTWNIDNSRPVTTFTYDGDGSRVKKIVGSDASIYIGSLFEKDASGKTTKHVFAGSNRICSIDSTGGAAFYHSDHIGSSNVITNASGQQTALTEFTPYGSISRQTGSFDPKYKFTGKELDPSTGIYFYGARYMDPELGRFISADTIVQAPYDPQSLNRYSYCRNNPINYVDPTGHSWFSKFFEQFFGTIVSIAFTFIGMPFIGAVAGSAISTIMNGGSFADFGIGLGIGLVSGYMGGTGAGCIARSLKMNLAGIETTFLRGALSGAIGGVGAAAIYGGDIRKGAWQGAASGMVVGGVMWAKNTYTTNKFLKNNVKWDSSVSDTDKAKFTQGIKEAGQSPLGQRIFSKYMASDRSVNISSITEINGWGTVGGNEIGLNPNADLLKGIGEPYEQFSTIDMGTYMLHEMGHNMGYSDKYLPSFPGQSLNVAYNENPYRAWIGTPARTGYWREGDVPFKRLY